MITNIEKDETSFELQHKVVRVNGVNLHVVQSGPEAGPLVLLLHGFPEFWYGWQAQIPFLTNAGYRVWVPDQRGYNLSDKPHGLAAYNLDILAQDVIGLIDASGHEKVYLVGHDWGGIVAWWVAIRYPQRLEKLVILDAPHPTVFQQALRRNPKQLRKSWYFFFFQIPWLPEKLMSRQNWRLAAQSLLRSSRPGTFSEADMEKYRQAWSQPNAMTNMLNWYRAILRKGPKMEGDLQVKVPTLIIWGARDKFILSTLAQASADKCRDSRLEMLVGASHWVQHEEADRVNSLLVEFFA